MPGIQINEKHKQVINHYRLEIIFFVTANTFTKKGILTMRDYANELIPKTTLSSDYQGYISRIQSSWIYLGATAQIKLFSENENQTLIRGVGI